MVLSVAIEFVYLPRYYMKNKWNQHINFIKHVIEFYNLIEVLQSVTERR